MIAGFRRRRRTITLVVMLLFLSLGIFQPIATVKGLQRSTGLINAGRGISIDAGRIAFLINGTTGPRVVVYDTACDTSPPQTDLACAGVPPRSVSFPAPDIINTTPMIYGDKVVIASFSSPTGQMYLFYCTLPPPAPPATTIVQPLPTCGPWVIIATVPGYNDMVQGPQLGFPVQNRDLVVWPDFPGVTRFDYYRFSTTTINFVNMPPGFSQPKHLSTNGAIIAFDSRPVNSTVPHIMYYDTAAATPKVVDTGAEGETGSISQYTIAFDGDSDLPTQCCPVNRVAYYDVVRNVAVPGPDIGRATYIDPFSQPAVWDDRIVFDINYTSLLDYWNVRKRPFESSTLDLTASPSAEPGFGFPSGGRAIYDKVIAFTSTDGTVHYVTVPMQGDVNLDGRVDIVDIAAAAICYGQVLKGMVC